MIDQDELRKLILMDMNQCEQDATTQLPKNTDTPENKNENKPPLNDHNDSYYFSEEQLLKAGYLPKPAGLKPLESIDTETLKGDLIDVALPVPKNYYKGNMYGENKIPIYDSNGFDLFASETAYLSEIIKRFLPAEAVKMLPAHMKTGLDDNITDETDEKGNSILNANANSKDQHNDITTVKNNYTAIMKHPLAQKYNLQQKDMAITPENELEVRKFLSGIENTTVKPFSIKAGVLGVNDDCILMIGPPDPLHGQPGHLMAIFRDDMFNRFSSDKPEPQYDTHTFTVHYQPNVEIVHLVADKQGIDPRSCEMADEMIIIDT